MAEVAEQGAAHLVAAAMLLGGVDRMQCNGQQRVQRPADHHHHRQGGDDEGELEEGKTGRQVPGQQPGEARGDQAGGRRPQQAHRHTQAGRGVKGAADRHGGEHAVVAP